MRITVYVSVWNFRDWIVQCLKSIQAQDHPDFEVIVGLDAPTDGTQAIARAAIGSDRRFTWLVWSERHYPLANIMRMHRHGAGEIGIRIDGDDYLPHERVLSRIAREYDDPACDMTHGSFVVAPSMGTVSPCRWGRQHGFAKWPFYHPISWRRSVAAAAMRDHPQAYLADDGTPFRFAGDVAWTYPIAATASKVVTIDEPLYVYRSHPGNEQFIDRSAQLATESKLGPYWNHHISMAPAR